MPGSALLNNVDHAGLRVRVGHGAEFGDDLNQLPIMASEFEEAQREYTIAFRSDGEGLRAVVLLGLDARENLFLTATGWNARYVPAIQRRGPLSAALRTGPAGEVAEVMIQVDLQHPRITRSGGEPMFLEHGGNAPVLEHMADALRTVHEGVAPTRALAAALDAAGLLQAVTLDVEVGDGRRYQISDVRIVDRDALAALDAEMLQSLNHRGYLQLAFLAAASLGNLGRLAARKRDKPGSADAGMLRG